MSEKKTCVIVDGYSAAARLADVVTRMGFDVVHVQSTRHIYFGAKGLPTLFLCHIGGLRLVLAI